MGIYLDSAATSAIRSEVITKIGQYMTEYIGNPSATHTMGRSTKSALETARKTIASHINATSNDIIFTSGATESIHWIINSCIAQGVKRIISSRIEHHAVLDTLEVVQSNDIRVDYLDLDESGNISVTHLVKLLQKEESPALVCLMHTNNETGTILDLDKVARICKQHNALILSDTVQAIGKTKFNVAETPLDYLIATAHKFHGPKGIGFIYKRKNSPLQTLFHGGGQEKGLRAGTENIHAILGMADALSISYDNLEKEQYHIVDLKSYAINELHLYFPEVKINGDITNSASHILNVMLPFSEKKTSMIVFLLDMKGIAISRGSACQSGSNKPSHVLEQILSEEDLKKPSIRISFSYQNTIDDVDALIEALKSIALQ